MPVTTSGIGQTLVTRRAGYLDAVEQNGWARLISGGVTPAGRAR